MTDYRVQLVQVGGGYLRDGQYLVRASTPEILDAVAKNLVQQHLHAADYMHREVDEPVPAIILLQDGGSLKLGQDISYDPGELAKIDWSALS